ncbi:MAG TPA: CYTH domain-containing protein [Anoxybacillus sp.]|nr:CYTH domain-containing protein [Anoxybacillus sp.]
MMQELEIEFKNLLTKEEFLTLKEAFQVSDEEFIYQENHYFDTQQFSLKEKGAALRIRVKNGVYTLTLKQPHKEGLLETHEVLTKEKAHSLLHGQAMLKGEVREIIKALGIEPEQIQYFGTLSTYRAQFDYKGGILVLDHSHYLQTDDYEIEYETTNFAFGKQVFEELLRSFNIPIRKTDNKIKRFYLKKYQIEGEQ